MQVCTVERGLLCVSRARLVGMHPGQDLQNALPLLLVTSLLAVEQVHKLLVQQVNTKALQVRPSAAFVAQVNTQLA